MEASGAQPPADAGAQGADGQDGPLEGYLEQVPSELREHVEPHLKAIERNVSDKFREAADYRKQWQPYEQLGINNVDPEALQGLLDFYNTAQDDDAFAQWFESVGQDAGLFEALGYQKADADELGDEFEGMSEEQIADLVRQAVAEEMAPVTERQAEFEQQQVVAEAEQEIADRLEQIRSENSDLFGDNPDQVEDAILRLAYSYAEDDEDDPVGLGFEEYKRVVGKGESGLLTRKAGQPGPIEGAGVADTSAPKITTFEQAQAAAKERLDRSTIT